MDDPKSEQDAYRAFQSLIIGHKALGSPGPGQKLGIHRGGGTSDAHARAAVQLRRQVFDVMRAGFDEQPR